MKLLLISIMVLVGASWQDQEPFRGFLGTWKREGLDYWEKWERAGDGGYRARAFRVGKGDTTVLETVWIYRERDNWVYAVRGEGKDTTIVRFRSIAITGHSVTFANPQHDFPTHISYTQPAGDRLEAMIYAGQDTVRFKFSRQ